jgi:hypothetical protein
MIFLGLIALVFGVEQSDLIQAQSRIDVSRCARGRSRPHIINGEVSKLCIQAINTAVEDRDCCIITYASFDPPYPSLLKQLLEKLADVFQGHVLYRIGGWPGMESGCLLHCHIPYAFKACAFEEAYRLGYKKVLWLDVRAEPLRPLGPLFEEIQQEGCLYRYAHGKLLRKLITPEILEDFQLSRNEIQKYRHIASGVLGFDFSKPAMLGLLREWHASAERGRSFYTSFPDEVPLSILLHKYGLHGLGKNLATFDKREINNAFFLFDYSKK